MLIAPRAAWNAGSLVSMGVSPNSWLYPVNPAGMIETTDASTRSVAFRGAPAPATHTACSARVFDVPGHGSPKSRMEDGTAHRCWPTHAFAATAVASAEQYGEGEKAPQAPVGVPKLAKVMEEMWDPAGQMRAAAPASAG